MASGEDVWSDEWPTIGRASESATTAGIPAGLEGDQYIPPVVRLKNMSFRKDNKEHHYIDNRLELKLPNNQV